jgi:hypothetical protein
MQEVQLLISALATVSALPDAQSEIHDRMPLKSQTARVIAALCFDTCFDNCGFQV